MIYENMIKARFLERPNRFIAHCQLGDEIVIAHVKNTGRCKELLVPGATVYLQQHNNPKRKTNYSLIAVQKGERLINMDSQVPNKVCIEALKKGILKLPGLKEDLALIKGEVTYGNSRFDVYVEAGDEKAFIEVKGVTLEENGVVKFPDAPTQRGVKHVEELIEAVKQDYKAYILFVIQMNDVIYFTPNKVTHKAFGEALKKAEEQGVKLLAYNCIVKKDRIELDKSIPIRL